MWLILGRVVLLPAVPLEYLAVCEHQGAGGQEASNDRQPHLRAEDLDKEEELSGGLLSQNCNATVAQPRYYVVYHNLSLTD